MTRGDDCNDLPDGADGMPGNSDDGANSNPEAAEYVMTGLTMTAMARLTMLIERITEKTQPAKITIDLSHVL